MKKKLKVGVVFGGPSSEHDISVKTGKQVVSCLDIKKYVPIAIKIPKKGDWLIPFIKKIKKVDVAFLALHGQFGEDGKIQAILDSIHIPYTGSGVLASSIAMDKFSTFRMLANEHILFPHTKLLRSKNDPMTLPLPLVVKPNASGSSIGVSLVKTKSELDQALQKAFREDRDVLVEEYIQGREFTCAVLGNSVKDSRALPVAEIKVATSFFDYKAKYTDKRTQEICPANIPSTLSRKIQKLALTIHTTLSCRGLTRSDFLVRNSSIYFLEINTIPGQTEASLCPKMAQANGWSMQEFFDKQLQLALRK